MLRFLDTRGLEDRDDYDPSEEVRLAEQQAHIILVSVRAEDMGLDAVQSQLAAALKRNPTRPVIVAQTRLHDLYPPSFTHIQPWPYGDEQFSGVPSDLRRALQHQRMLFRNAVCPVSPTFVPIDFTNEKDCFSPLDYGATALRAALRDALLKSRNTNHPEAPDAQTYEHDLKSNLDGAKAS